MKCKNCGGEYKTKELKCPYCATENLLGKLWSIQRSEAEITYEKERKRVGKYLTSPYMLNRLVSRGLVILVSLFLLVFVGAFLFFYGEEVYKNLSYKWNKEKIEAQMQVYYENGDWELLDDYMEEHVIDRTQYYTYMQAVVLHDNYQRYLEYRLKYNDLSETKKLEDDYYLESAIEYSARVYNLDCGIYDELDEKNRSLYETYQREILAYWIGELALTEEEIELVIEGRY